MLKFLKCKVKNVHKSAQEGVSQSDLNAPNKEDTDETFNNAAKNCTVNADENSPQSVSENVSIAAASDESQGATENTSQNAAEDIPNSSSLKASRDPDQLIRTWIVCSVGISIFFLGLIVFVIGVLVFYGNATTIAKALSNTFDCGFSYIMCLLVALMFAPDIGLIVWYFKPKCKIPRIIVGTSLLFAVAICIVGCISVESARSYSDALVYAEIGNLIIVYGIATLGVSAEFFATPHKEKLLDMSAIIISTGALILTLIQLFKK